MVRRAPRLRGARQRFPWSLALVGLRDVRDYHVAFGTDGRLGTASPFNIKVESLTLRNFTADEIAELYQQHTDDTGQRFTPDALLAAFDETQGQPWLVNALARQLVEVVVPDHKVAITPDHVLAARQILIGRMDTHVDSLAKQLREPRVRRILAPMIAGGTLPEVSVEDQQYLIDLGLLRLDVMMPSVSVSGNGQPSGSSSSSSGHRSERSRKPSPSRSRSRQPSGAMPGTSGQASFRSRKGAPSRLLGGSAIVAISRVSTMAGA